MITHDIGVAAEIGERVVVMQNGAVVEQGPIETVLAAPKHPYTKRLLDSVPGRHGYARKREYKSEPILEITRPVKILRSYQGHFDGSIPVKNVRALDNVTLSAIQGRSSGHCRRKRFGEVDACQHATRV